MNCSNTSVILGATGSYGLRHFFYITIKEYAMKFNRFGSLMAAATVASLFATGAAQADTVSVTVNAQIIGICKFNSGQTPVVTIANTGVTIDPSLAGPATGTAAILYRCTK